MSSRGVTRREFGIVAAGALGSFALGGACHLKLPAGSIDEGRLKARPVAGVKTTVQGTSTLGLEPARDAILQLPSKIPAGPIPLIVLLHGAGGAGERILR